MSFQEELKKIEFGMKMAVGGGGQCYARSPLRQQFFRLQILVDSFCTNSSRDA